MRKLLIFAALILSSVSCYAQTTTISATVTDSTSTAWANGTWKIEFVPNPSNPNPAAYNINGTPLSAAVTFQTGSLDGSGAFSASVYQNVVITPVGSSWKLTVCPNSTAPCGIYGFIAAGSSMSLSSALTSAIPVIKFSPVSGAYGYNDAEAILNLLPGSTYWNVTSSIQRCYTGSAWTTCTPNSGFPSIVPCAIASGCTAATNAQDARTNLTVPGFLTISGQPTVGCSASVNDGSYYVDISTFIEYKCILVSSVWGWHQTGVGAIYNIPTYGTSINFYDTTGVYPGGSINSVAILNSADLTFCSLPAASGSASNPLDYWCLMRFGAIQNKLYFGDDGTNSHIQSGVGHDILFCPGGGGYTTCAGNPFALRLSSTTFDAVFGHNIKVNTYQETLVTPASSSAACTAGQFTDDANYHYVCTATNTWKRVALSTF